MPMIDAFIPEGALKPKAEERLMKELTDILVSLEGIEPENERARAASVIFLHRPKVYVAGVPAAAPRYRFIPWLPEGQCDDDVRRLLVKAVLEAVARAEGARFEDVKSRVSICPNAESTWGGRAASIDLDRVLDAPVVRD